MILVLPDYSVNKKVAVSLLCLFAIVINIMIGNLFHLNKVVLSGDGDRAFYLEEMPTILKHQKSHLTYPMNRCLQPLIANGISKIFGVGIESSMVTISFISYIGIALFLLMLYFNGKACWYVPLIFLSFPFSILYQLTYHVEMALALTTILSFFSWIEYCKSNKIKLLVYSIIFSAMSILVKEIYLYFLGFVFFYTLVQYPKKIPQFLVISMISFFVFYLNYFTLYEALIKPYMLNTETRNILSMRAQSLDIHRHFDFFVKPFSRGHFFHFIFAFFLTFFLWPWVAIYQKKKERGLSVQLMVLGVISAGMLMVLISTMGAGSKYIFSFIVAPLLYFIKDLGFSKNNFLRILILQYVLSIVILIIYSAWHLSLKPHIMT